MREKERKRRTFVIFERVMKHQKLGLELQRETNTEATKKGGGHNSAKHRSSQAHTPHLVETNKKAGVICLNNEQATPINCASKPWHNQTQ